MAKVSKNLQQNNSEIFGNGNDKEIPKEIQIKKDIAKGGYISPEEIQKTIDNLRLMEKKIDFLDNTPNQP